MKPRTIAVVILALLLGFGAGALAQLGEQERRIQPPVFVTSGDIGFSIEGYRGRTVVGHMMVKIDGHWRDAQPSAAGGSLRPAFKFN